VLGFAQCPPARRALSHPAVTAPQQVGVPGQRGCLACVQRGWPWKHLLCWSLGARGGLGAALQQGADGLHFSVTASASGQKIRRGSGAVGSGWLWRFYPTVSRVDELADLVLVDSPGLK
jgi:hypothetical protein